MRTRANSASALVASAAFLLLSMPMALAAQQGLFFDTVDVKVVNVEVTVTEKDGTSVRGLTADDFEILEDGRRVEISNFFAVEGREVARDDVTVGLGSAEDLTAEPETTRLNLVVFIDNLNMDPRNRNTVFSKLQTYIAEQLDENDRLMIVSMGERIEIVEQFTNQRDRLVETLDRMSRETGSLRRTDTEMHILLRNIQRAVISGNPAVSGSSGPPSMEWEQAIFNADRLARDASLLAEVRLRNVRSTVIALEHFCNALAGMPGRKALLYVSDGLPLRPADSLAQAWLNKYEAWIQGQAVMQLRPSLQEMIGLSGGSRFDASSAFDRLVAHASASQVVFYPLSNARGLRSQGISAEHQGSGTSTGGGAFSANVASLEALSVEGSLLRMAEGTGGVAFTRSSNVEGLLSRVAHDFDTFYSLGFVAPHGDDGEMHKIDVRLRGRGRDRIVRHANSHREKDPVELLADLTLSALEFNAVENTLNVLLEPLSAEPIKGKRYLVDIIVKIPFQDLLLLPDRDSHVGQVSLVVVVRDETDGGLSKPQRIDLPIKIPNAQASQIARRVVAYPLRLEISAGPKRIAVGVRDQLARIDSTVDLEIDIPSGLVATTEPPAS